MHNKHRNIEAKLLHSLQNFPVTYVSGLRQTGKTTLVQKLANSQDYWADYITFDNLQMRESAKSDPQAFLRSFKGNIILDEIQLVPELFRPLKIIVDENRQFSNGGKGKFLLTGSASIMALPQLSDALVGRMSIHQLSPFSATEVYNNANNIIDLIFSNNFGYEKVVTKNDLFNIIKSATFPEISDITDNDLRHTWCDGYINIILQRDVRALAEIEKLSSLPAMLKLIATRTGAIDNESSLARDMNLNYITLRKYRALLEGLFLTMSIPAYSENIGKRLIKASKVYICDINILVYLLGAKDINDILAIGSFKDQLIENFIALELSKQLTWANTHAKLYHYRTSSGQEIDFILEGALGKCVAIEVKAKSNVSTQDFKQINNFADNMGDKFICGIVFYTGDEVTSMGKNLWAVPINKMWS
jgi:predicted AAA+ superfamily ATPase